MSYGASDVNRRTITAMFDSQADAYRAVKRLVSAGIRRRYLALRGHVLRLLHQHGQQQPGQELPRLAEGLVPARRGPLQLR